MQREGKYYQDEFLHEQYLVLSEGGKRVLLSGCAHNGILNILDRYREIFGAGRGGERISHAEKVRLYQGGFVGDKRNRDRASKKKYRILHRALYGRNSLSDNEGMHGGEACVCPQRGRDSFVEKFWRKKFFRRIAA